MRQQKIDEIMETVSVQAVRQGLVSVIPILMVGAFSLVIKSFPLQVYQHLISNWLNGEIVRLCDSVYNATFGLISAFMTLSIGYHYAVLKRNRESGAKIGCPITSLAVFTVLTGYQNLSIDTFGPKGMFLAIAASILASSLFCSMLSVKGKDNIDSDGMNINLNDAIHLIWPTVITILVFAAGNELLLLLSGGRNAHQLLLSGANGLFSLTSNDFLRGFLFVLVSSILWFFGIHGSDVLEGVSSTLFAPNAGYNAALASAGLAPTEILTKQTFDVFILMGGCGSTICLLIAILMFSKRQGNKKLAKIASIPMLFNINELMVFGLPIILNTGILIPFICTPLVCYITTYLAMYTGLVPMVTASVEWTTPVLIGGYMATKSVAGIALQLFNLVVGVLIYRPFVIKYDNVRISSLDEDYADLVMLMKKSEASRQPANLMAQQGRLGAFVKGLSAEFKRAFQNGELQMYYQPQYQLDGTCLGAEALLRWSHPDLGYIYPPLILELADENGMLLELEKWVVSRIVEDTGYLGEDLSESLIMSVNITGISIQNEAFEEFLADIAGERRDVGNICLELTEQAALSVDDELRARLMRLRNLGYHLAIDDFSMGSTSLQYLQSNEFDLVKLDGSLVKKSQHNARSREIISSIISLSHNLDFEVLAEFVSTVELRDCMANLGCTRYQGWYYAKAMPLDAFKEHLASKQSDDAVID